MNITTKIMLGLPTNRGVKPRTAESLLRLAAHSKIVPIVSTKGYNTAENRNWIAAQAIKKGCSHLLLVDDDMIYEPDSLERLLKHDKDIIGATYYTKYENPQLVIEYLDEKDGDLFKCKALGGGLLLIKTEVFLKTPQPWFGYKWHDNGMIKMSNDWFFCEKAREAGFDIWVDMTLKPRHIGEKEF